MNVRPEYIRYLDLPEMDIDPLTLPVEKRLFLVWVVNPLYSTDQITEQYTSLAAATETFTAYTVPEGYRFELHALSVESDAVNDVLDNISTIIAGNTQAIYFTVAGGALQPYRYATVTPTLLMKEGDSIDVTYNFAAGGNIVTANLLGWLYEVAAEE